MYDGACPVCSAAVAWIRKNARKNTFEMVPCQSETMESRFPGIPQHVCMRAMQLVLPDGRVLSGEQALPEVLARLPRYRGIGAFFRIPGLPALSRILYRWFAENRYGIARLLKREDPRNRGRKRS